MPEGGQWRAEVRAPLAAPSLTAKKTGQIRRRSRAHELRPEELALGQVFSAAPVALLAASPEGEIVAANATAEKLLGYAARELRRRTLPDLLHPDHRWPSIAGGVVRLLRRGGNSYEWFFLAMAQARLGEPEKARPWYDKAVRWMQEHEPKNDELRRFREEAAGGLKIDGAQ